MKARKSMRKESGFTLLETLIATVLITVGVTALIGALSIWLAASSDIENTSLALNLAQAKIETLYDGYATVADEAEAVIPGFESPAAQAAGYGTAFRQQVAVTVLDAYRKRVDVTVSWDARGGESSVSLVTLLTSH